jgi:uroporphyrinogen-III synthase
VRLLVTRPEPDAGRTAAALRRRGHAVFVAPLLHIEPLTDADLGAGPWSAILITSANAAAAVATHERFAELRALPAFAVGDRSADAIRAVGLRDVASAGGDVGDLAKLVAERLNPPARLLYLAAQDRSADLAGLLRALGFVVDTVAVYRAVMAAALSAETVTHLSNGVEGVLHFSRRTAEAYVNVSRAAGVLAAALRPAHYCPSARAAEPLLQAGATNVTIAPEPTEAALFALIPGT